MKRINRLLALCAVLILLAGAAAVITCIDFDEPAEETQTYTVFSLADTEMTGISWYYSGNQIGFVKDGENWFYGEDENLPVDSAVLQDMELDLEEISSNKVIENVTDLAQYGLEEPTQTVTVTNAEGTETVLRFGAETQMGGQVYMSNGDGNVYLVDSALAGEFSYALYDLVLEEAIPDMDDVMGFQVEAQTQSLDLQYLEDSGIGYSDEYDWFAVADGGYVMLDTERVNSFTGNVQNMTWISCADYYADETELEAYGLTDPAVTVSVTYLAEIQVETAMTTTDGAPVYDTRQEQRQFVLEIGGYADSDCYARIQGSSMVYLIDGSICDALLYTTSGELLPDEALLMQWEKVSTVEIILDGQTHTLTIGTETVTDEEGNTTEETVYTMNGEEVNAISILTGLDVLRGSDYAIGVEPQRDEEIRFVIHQGHEVYPVVELVLYQYDSESCLAQLNGESTLFVDREDVVELVEKINTLLLS